MRSSYWTVTCRRHTINKAKFSASDNPAGLQERRRLLQSGNSYKSRNVHNVHRWRELELFTYVYWVHYVGDLAKNLQGTLLRRINARMWLTRYSVNALVGLGEWRGRTIVSRSILQVGVGSTSRTHDEDASRKVSGSAMASRSIFRVGVGLVSRTHHEDAYGKLSGSAVVSRRIFEGGMDWSPELTTKMPLGIDCCRMVVHGVGWWEHSSHKHINKPKTNKSTYR